MLVIMALDVTTLGFKPPHMEMPVACVCVCCVVGFCVHLYMVVSAFTDFCLRISICLYVFIVWGT